MPLLVTSAAGHSRPSDPPSDSPPQGLSRPAPPPDPNEVLCQQDWDALLRLLREAMPDFELCVDELLIEQGRSSLRWTVTGTDVRGVLGIRPGGGPVVVQGTTRSRWTADRPVECWVSWQPAR